MSYEVPQSRLLCSQTKIAPAPTAVFITRPVSTNKLLYSFSAMRDKPPSAVKNVLTTADGMNRGQSLNYLTQFEKCQEAETRWLFRHADAVCFDVDSTVCKDEAIDELASFCGVGEQVAAWTKKAMNGNFSFREALHQRLELIKPSRFQMEQYLRRNPPKLTPGIKDVISVLHRRDVPVFLVTGGFLRIILQVAKILGIPEGNVFANVLHFDQQGEYDGFDETQPTSDSEGKPVVCGMLKSRFGFQRLIMIGDGATDMEACPPADAFIGFGGNQVRENVRRVAPWYVYDFKELLEELEKDDD